MSSNPSSGARQSDSNNWIEIQKSLMDSWLKMASTWMDVMASSPAQGSTKEPKTTSPDIYNQWMKVWGQSMRMMTETANPIMKSAFEQFNSAQEYSLKFMDFTNRIWNAMTSVGESGEELNEVIKQNREKVLSEWVNFPNTIMATTQDINNLWELYSHQWERYGQPWFSFYQVAPEHLSRMMSGDSQGLMDFSDLFRNTYQETLGQLVTSPNLGPTRELNEMFLKGFDSFVTWQLAYQDYQSILVETWRVAIEDYFDRILLMAERGEKVESVRELILLWTRGAEEIFTQTFSTERYALVQGKMLNAAMQYRKQVRLIQEEILNLYDLPTRSELDETHRRIYELRKEVKRLNKELQLLQAQVENPQASKGTARKATTTTSSVGSKPSSSRRTTKSKAGG